MILLRDLIKNLNITVLAVSSDVKGAIKYFSEFIVIDDSKIHWKGERSTKFKKTNKFNQTIVDK